MPPSGDKTWAVLTYLAEHYPDKNIPAGEPSRIAAQLGLSDALVRQCIRELDYTVEHRNRTYKIGLAAFRSHRNWGKRNG